MTKEQLIKDCAFLSSGTMANITGTKQFDILDKIQGEFITFVDNSKTTFSTWVHAWEEYWNNKK